MTTATMIPHKRLPEEQNWFEPLKQLLQSYQPTTEADAEKWFSTAELMSQLEQHFGMSQGDADKSMIDGADFVEAMSVLGYKAGNIAGSGLYWLLKKK